MKEIYFLILDIHFGGGGERVAANLANYFAEQGYQVTIVTIATPERKNIFKLDKKIKVDYLAVDFKKGINLIQKIKSIYAVKSYFSDKIKSGIVLGIGTYPNLLLSFVPKRTILKRIGCQHCSFESLNSKWRWFGKMFFVRLDALISLTREDVPNWEKMNRHVFVIPNSITFFPAEAASLNNKVILSVGRIDFSKGYDLLLHVFGRFAEKNQEWRLKIIGDGPEKGKLVSQILKNGLEKRIEILPPTSNILEEYLNASVYVMTSRSEGLPMVLLEAKACGLPLLSFDVKTGPSEIIRDGKDGFLIKSFKVDEMTEKLLDLCSDISRRREFGIYAREDVKRFSPDLIGNKWKALFNELTPEMN